MYRYEPPPDKEPQASWREILELSWVAMTIVMPVVGLVLGVMVLVLIFFWCLSIHPALTLLPLSVFVSAALVVIFIDRRNQARLEAEAAGREPERRR
jgi:hypothetical protein